MAPSAGHTEHKSPSYLGFQPPVRRNHFNLDLNFRGTSRRHHKCNENFSSPTSIAPKEEKLTALQESSRIDILSSIRKAPLDRMGIDAFLFASDHAYFTGKEIDIENRFFMVAQQREQEAMNELKRFQSLPIFKDHILLRDESFNDLPPGIRQCYLHMNRLKKYRNALESKGEEVSDITQTIHNIMNEDEIKERPQVFTSEELMDRLNPYDRICCLEEVLAWMDELKEMPKDEPEELEVDVDQVPLDPNEPMNLEVSQEVTDAAAKFLETCYRVFGLLVMLTERRHQVESVIGLELRQLRDRLINMTISSTWQDPNASSSVPAQGAGDVAGRPGVDASVRFLGSLAAFSTESQLPQAVSGVMGPEGGITDGATAAEVPSGPSDVVNSNGQAVPLLVPTSGGSETGPPTEKPTDEFGETQEVAAENITDKSPDIKTILADKGIKSYLQVPHKLASEEGYDKLPEQDDVINGLLLDIHKRVKQINRVQTSISRLKDGLPELSSSSEESDDDSYETASSESYVSGSGSSVSSRLSVLTAATAATAATGVSARGLVPKTWGEVGRSLSRQSANRPSSRVSARSGRSGTEDRPTTREGRKSSIDTSVSRPGTGDTTERSKHSSSGRKRADSGSSRPASRDKPKSRGRQRKGSTVPLPQPPQRKGSVTLGTPFGSPVVRARRGSMAGSVAGSVAGGRRGSASGRRSSGAGSLAGVAIAASVVGRKSSLAGSIVHPGVKLDSAAGAPTGMGGIMARRDSNASSVVGSGDRRGRTGSVASSMNIAAKKRSKRRTSKIIDVAAPNRPGSAMSTNSNRSSGRKKKRKGSGMNFADVSLAASEAAGEKKKKKKKKKRGEDSARLSVVHGALVNEDELEVDIEKTEVEIGVLRYNNELMRDRLNQAVDQLIELKQREKEKFRRRTGLRTEEVQAAVKNKKRTFKSVAKAIGAAAMLMKRLKRETSKDLIYMSDGSSDRDSILDNYGEGESDEDEDEINKNIANIVDQLMDTSEVPTLENVIDASRKVPPGKNDVKARAPYIPFSGDPLRPGQPGVFLKKEAVEATNQVVAKKKTKDEIQEDEKSDSGGGSVRIGGDDSDAEKDKHPLSDQSESETTEEDLWKTSSESDRSDLSFSKDVEKAKETNWAEWAQERLTRSREAAQSPSGLSDHFPEPDPSPELVSSSESEGYNSDYDLDPFERRLPEPQPSPCPYEDEDEEVLPLKEVSDPNSKPSTPATGKRTHPSTPITASSTSPRPSASATPESLGTASSPVIDLDELFLADLTPQERKGMSELPEPSPSPELDGDVDDDYCATDWFGELRVWHLRPQRTYREGEPRPASAPARISLRLRGHSRSKSQRRSRGMSRGAPQGEDGTGEGDANWPWMEGGTMELVEDATPGHSMTAVCREDGFLPPPVNEKKTASAPEAHSKTEHLRSHTSACVANKTTLPSSKLAEDTAMVSEPTPEASTAVSPDGSSKAVAIGAKAGKKSQRKMKPMSKKKSPPKSKLAKEKKGKKPAKEDKHTDVVSQVETSAQGGGENEEVREEVASSSSESEDMSLKEAAVDSMKNRPSSADAKKAVDTSEVDDFFQLLRKRQAMNVADDVKSLNSRRSSTTSSRTPEASRMSTRTPSAFSSSTPGLVTPHTASPVAPTPDVSPPSLIAHSQMNKKLSIRIQLPTTNPRSPRISYVPKPIAGINQSTIFSSRAPLSPSDLSGAPSFVIRLGKDGQARRVSTLGVEIPVASSARGMSPRAVGAVPVGMWYKAKQKTQVPLPMSKQTQPRPAFTQRNRLTSSVREAYIREALLAEQTAWEDDLPPLDSVSGTVYRINSDTAQDAARRNVVYALMRYLSTAHRKLKNLRLLFKSLRDDFREVQLGRSRSRSTTTPEDRIHSHAYGDYHPTTLPYSDHFLTSFLTPQNSSVSEAAFFAGRDISGWVSSRSYMPPMVGSSFPGKTRVPASDCNPLSPPPEERKSKQPFFPILTRAPPTSWDRVCLDTAAGEAPAVIDAFPPRLSALHSSPRPQPPNSAPPGDLGVARRAAVRRIKQADRIRHTRHTAFLRRQHYESVQQRQEHAARMKLHAAQVKQREVQRISPERFKLPSRDHHQERSQSRPTSRSRSKSRSKSRPQARQGQTSSNNNPILDALLSQISDDAYANVSNVELPDVGSSRMKASTGSRSPPVVSARRPLHANSTGPTVSATSAPLSPRPGPSKSNFSPRRLQKRTKLSATTASSSLKHPGDSHRPPVPEYSGVCNRSNEDKDAERDSLYGRGNPVMSVTSEESPSEKNEPPQTRVPSLPSLRDQKST
eukprot:Rmarinus@m.24411